MFWHTHQVADDLSNHQRSSCNELLLVIDDVFRIQGRGTVVTGLLDRNAHARLTAGDGVEVRDGATVLLKTQVQGVETITNGPASPGREHVGVLIATDASSQIRKGHMLWKVSKA
jgi:translation elongation factor EF-Tu-like GTPase